MGTHEKHLNEMVLMSTRIMFFCVENLHCGYSLEELASVAQLDARPTGDQEVAGLTPCRSRQHSSVEVDNEIFSTVILSLRLIQEGQLSASGERMCTILVNRLED